MIILGYILAIAMGISLGLLGGGGSVLALPVLVYVMGVPTKSAIAMTLIIVGSISFLGSITRRSSINFRMAGIFGIATMVGAYGGARLAVLVSSSVQMILFGIAMLMAAGFMIYRAGRSPANSNYIKPLCKYCWLWLPTEGLGVGLLTGLVGVGGGFAIVPALVLLANIPMEQAIATSMLIIGFNSLAGLAGYIGAVTLDWDLIISFTFLAGIGTVIGSYLGQFVSSSRLQKSFGYFLMALGVLVIVQNWDNLVGG